MAQSYKINGSTNGFENKDFASFKVKFYNCEKRIGRFDSGVEKSAAQNVASQGPVHDCTCTTIKLRPELDNIFLREVSAVGTSLCPYLENIDEIRVYG